MKTMGIQICLEPKGLFALCWAQQEKLKHRAKGSSGPQDPLPCGSPATHLRRFGKRKVSEDPKPQNPKTPKRQKTPKKTPKNFKKTSENTKNLKTQGFSTLLTSRWLPFGKPNRLPAARRAACTSSAAVAATFASAVVGPAQKTSGQLWVKKKSFKR